MTNSPLAHYTQRHTQYLAEYALARRSSSHMSNARLAVFLIALAGFLWFIFQDQVFAALAFVLGGTGLFIAFMVRHERILAREKQSQHLAKINALGMDRLNGTWTEFPIKGEEWVSETHPYSSDLDLFGTASLYQLLNCTQTELGRRQLKEVLLSPPRTVQEITQSQSMVQDLAPRLAWRQEFQAAGGFSPVLPNKENPNQLLAWMQEQGFVQLNAIVSSLLRILPLFSLGISIFVWVKLGLSSLLILPFLFQWGLSSWLGRNQGKLLGGLNYQKKNLEVYRAMLAHVDSEQFQDGNLNALKQSLANEKGMRASMALQRLITIVEYLATRQNPVLHFLVNAALLWDMQWISQLHDWRKDNAARFQIWLENIAQFEAHASLSLLAFENPDWTFPKIEKAGAIIDAKAMAHPLISSTRRIGNNLQLTKSGEVLIITGSNMSGKSTLMRTVGINLVLAYAGAPVCAQSFTCIPVHIFTSMRLRDDLDKRISSFYAELVKIKTIVEAAKNGTPVLFLVDEIFRGTNSKDRHAGAMAVLRQLHQLGASGLVSTHDLELAQLEQIEPGHFRNQHFQETYSEGKIHFDFKITEGVSTTTNAMHLLKMVGLG